MSDNPFRLPRHVTPSHYDIRLDLDFDTLTFEGVVSIDVGVSEPTEEIVLNTADLEISEVELTGSQGEVAISGIDHDEEFERATFKLVEAIRPGSYSLRLAYRGIINDQLKGLYQSTYRDGDGNEHLIATSQCQSTDARRIIPCWDEPDFKATFQTTMVVPEGLEAYSNAAELERTNVGEGRVEFRFAPTMKMSSYLLAFIAGPFEATEPRVVRGTPMRIIVPKGNLHLTDVAMENAVFCFEYLSDYYGIPYPGDKLDHVAIPTGFASLQKSDSRPCLPGRASSGAYRRLGGAEFVNAGLGGAARRAEELLQLAAGLLQRLQFAAVVLVPDFHAGELDLDEVGQGLKGLF